jgi:acetophenone carboxylase
LEVPPVGYTIDVDIGGTLTDGLFSDGQRAEMVKVDTTPHDFTVCFFECLNEGARRFGHEDLARFLQEVAVIRWSSTIATNVIAERKGPKLGLLVSRPPVENLYGSGPSPAIGYLVAPQHVEVVGTPVDRADILRAARQLLERGARRICVSLAGAHLNPRDERLAKTWIEEQYPDHYLGSVPVLLGSDMLHHPDDQTRTHLALINAYVHTPLATSLFKAEDEILQMRYRHPIYVGHVNGGVARISKTKGVDTTESGPIFGLQASAYFAREYGFDRVLSLDVGGTTSKIGLVERGEPAMADRGDVFGLGLQVPWIVLHSVAIGGGSVAQADGSGLALGPESMGAYPGPACYDLGGQLPTLTDALLLAGMLNPDRFLGGRRRLDLDRARDALQAQVAKPLGVSVEAAALRVIDQAVSQITQTAEQLPDGGQSLLFAFGGNGANLAVAAAHRLGYSRALVFQLGPVFSAFGSSVSMIRHVEESWPESSLDDAAARRRVAAVLDEARARMLRDVAGEGFDPATARISTELLIREQQGERSVELDPGADTFAPALERLAGGDGHARVIERATVVAVCPVPRYQPPRLEGERHSPEPTGRRRILTADGEVEAAIFDWDALRPGAVAQGPAVLEASANTCTIPKGWRVEVDGYGNGTLTRVEG